MHHNIDIFETTNVCLNLNNSFTHVYELNTLRLSNSNNVNKYLFWVLYASFLSGRATNNG